MHSTQNEMNMYDLKIMPARCEYGWNLRGKIPLDFKT